MNNAVLERLGATDAYQGYSYSYPHKTAYRAIEPALPLDVIWQNESRESIFLYMHIPFCEMRCGFCNLFTTANPQQSLEKRYVDTLSRQAEVVANAIGKVTVSRMALGGGTPTYLEADSLARLFEVARSNFGTAQVLPCSVETSPLTAQNDRLAVLKQYNVDRISIGVQSFVEEEVAAVGRAQKTADVTAAIERIRVFGFPILNIDLIYGLPGQTPASWMYSLEQTVASGSEEIYLYPLYVRPLTGLGRKDKHWQDDRLRLYRQGRDFLLERGYVQSSMRMFQRQDGRLNEGPKYCCQTDGMIGLGSGARSYTQSTHYSTRFAVAKDKVKAIINQYIEADNTSFASAEWGFVLSEQERKHRHVIQSLLQIGDGLDLLAYGERFGSDAQKDVPELVLLEQEKLVQHVENRLYLTELGVELSDVVGRSLYTEDVRELMVTSEVL